jgi:hypothetical protein
MNVCAVDALCNPDRTISVCFLTILHTTIGKIRFALCETPPYQSEQDLLVKKAHFAVDMKRDR